MTTWHDPARGDDPYAVLGLSPQASPEQITTAYHKALRHFHPDTAHPDRDRLAAVLAAYHHLQRDAPEPDTCDFASRQEPHSAHRSHPSTPPRSIPVRHHTRTPAPDLRAGPVHHHAPPP